MLFLPFDRRINDRIPFVVFALVAVNVAITVHTFFGFDEERINAIFMDWGAIPTDLKPSAWVTHMFLHAGPAHVVGNVAFLILFGMNVERRLGSVVTLALYFLSGFAALALFLAFNRDFDGPLVGASGAVSGIVGMYLVLFRKRTVEVLWFAFFVGGLVRLKSVVVASFWIGLELLQALLLNEKAVVAHWAHVGGFAGGAALTVLIIRLYKGHPEVYAAHEEEAKAPDRFDEKAYIPDAPAAPRGDGMRLVAREWRPMSGLVRRIVDGVAPGSGAFARPSRVAAGLAAPQADDLRGRLERAGYPSAVLPQKDEVPEAPVVFIDRLDIVPDGIAIVDFRGCPQVISPANLVRIQTGIAGSTPILDLVTRDPWRRYRMSGATAAVPVEERIEWLREPFPGFESAERPFESLAEMDEYFRWRLQRPV
jgi:membrane associated rhomboid family serine protease